MELILGSQSPRRKEVLNFFNIPFKQISPSFDEDSIPFQDPPQAYVQILAEEKAKSLAHIHSENMILTADTIVYKEGKIFGKAKDQIEALEFLKELNGKWHHVFTGLALLSNGITYKTYEETRVLFNLLTHQQMLKYLQAIPFLDKAGGYMIQGAGSLIVKSIEGCYYNVVGFPINALYRILKEVKIDLWNQLKKEI